jgi:hypothetical protein
MALPYHSIVVKKEAITISRAAVFKLYFISIIGREDRKKYEWEFSPYTMQGFLQQFPGRGLEGIGFIVAFPHVTKVFRFGPRPETNLHALAFETPTWKPISLDRDGWSEVACAAEMDIGADEFRFWAESAGVEEYLKKFSERGAVAIKNHNKLEKYSQSV